MQESAEVPLGPPIQNKTGEIKLPYQEQKEQWGKKKFDTLIVFGQGPVKRVLLADELNDQQIIEWEEFKKDPLHGKEPNFRVIEGKAYLELFSNLSNNDKKLKRQEWQNMGRLTLNRWSRQNALAAGLALYLGITDKLILSGGKTGKPQGVDDNDWPSEAQLMRDIIVRAFGDKYQQTYGKSIETAINLEDKSINTLENFEFIINNNPELTQKDKKFALLSADFQLRRVAQLARIFSVNIAPHGEISPQDLLKERAEIRTKDQYTDVITYMKDSLRNPDLRRRLEGEQLLERGIIGENFIEYWIGYMADIKDLRIMQQIITALSNKAWVIKTSETFEKIGLKFSEFQDLSKLTNDQIEELRTKLRDNLQRGSTLRETSYTEMKNTPFK